MVNLTVVGEDEDAAKTAVSATLAHMSHLESILSRHQANSQLSQLNQNGRFEQPDTALVTVLNQALTISTLSAGAFDVTVKPLVDLYQDYQTRNELPPKTAVLGQPTRPRVTVRMSGIGTMSVKNAKPTPIVEKSPKLRRSRWFPDPSKQWE